MTKNKIYVCVLPDGRQFPIESRDMVYEIQKMANDGQIDCSFTIHETEDSDVDWVIVDGPHIDIRAMEEIIALVSLARL